MSAFVYKNNMQEIIIQYFFVFITKVYWVKIVIHSALYYYFWTLGVIITIYVLQWSWCFYLHGYYACIFLKGKSEEIFPMSYLSKVIFRVKCRWCTSMVFSRKQKRFCFLVQKYSILFYWALCLPLQLRSSFSMVEPLIVQSVE